MDVAVNKESDETVGYPWGIYVKDYRNYELSEQTRKLLSESQRQAICVLPANI